MVASVIQIEKFAQNHAANFGEFSIITLAPVGFGQCGEEQVALVLAETHGLLQLPQKRTRFVHGIVDRRQRGDLHLVSHEAALELGDVVVEFSEILLGAAHTRA
jgi:hypothetical protein